MILNGYDFVYIYNICRYTKNYIYVVDDPSKSAWDEDDPTPSRRSAWDLPTPSSYSRRSERSDRSMKSSYDRSERRY